MSNNHQDSRQRSYNRHGGGDNGNKRRENNGDGGGEPRNRNNDSNGYQKQSFQRNRNTGNSNTNKRCPEGRERSQQFYRNGSQGSSSIVSKYGGYQRRSPSPRSRSPSRNQLSEPAYRYDCYHNNTSRSQSPWTGYRDSRRPSSRSPSPDYSRRPYQGSSYYRSPSPTYDYYERSRSPSPYWRRDRYIPPPKYNNHGMNRCSQGSYGHDGYRNGTSNRDDRRGSASQRHSSPPRNRSSALIRDENEDQVYGFGWANHNHQDDRNNFSSNRNDQPGRDYAQNRDNRRRSRDHPDVSLNNKFNNQSLNRNGRSPVSSKSNPGHDAFKSIPHPETKRHGESKRFRIPGQHPIMPKPDSFLRPTSPEQLYLGETMNLSDDDETENQLVKYIDQKFRDENLQIQKEFGQVRANRGRENLLEVIRQKKRNERKFLLFEKYLDAVADGKEPLRGTALNQDWISYSPPTSPTPSSPRSGSPCNRESPGLYTYHSRRIVSEDFRGKHLQNPCLFCEGTHRADQCPIIVNAEERMEFLKKSNRCFRCFKRHPIERCEQIVEPQCKYCYDKDPTYGLHHPAICLEAYPVFDGEEETEKWQEVDIDW